MTIQLITISLVDVKVSILSTFLYEYHKNTWPRPYNPPYRRIRNTDFVLNLNLWKGMNYHNCNQCFDFIHPKHIRKSNVFLIFSGSEWVTGEKIKRSGIWKAYFLLNLQSPFSQFSWNPCVVFYGNWNISHCWKRQ